MAHFDFIAGTVIGRKHGENQDRTLVRTITRDNEPPIHLLAVADGISECPFGGSVSRWLVSQHLEVDDIFTTGTLPLREQLESYLQGLHREFKREFCEIEEMLASGCTLSTAVIQGEYVDYSWAGNSPIYVSHRLADKYETHRVSIPDEIPQRNILTDSFGAQNPFRLKHGRERLHDHSIVTLATDGVTFDAVLFNEAYQRLGFDEAVVAEALAAARTDRLSDDSSVVAGRKLFAG